MEAWIPITLAAALFQTARTALQKHLKSRLSTTGATFARFLYAWPLALLYVAGLAALAELPVPDPGLAFVFHSALGGLAQIAGTAALVHLFSYRNFAVGTAYSKTETVQTALVGVVVLGEAPTATAAVAILVSLVGVLTISTARQKLGLLSLFAHRFDRPALIGIASGAGFGIAAVSYRAAALSLGGEGYVMQAAFTLASVLMFQTAAMALYMRLREPGEIGAVLRSWRVSGWVGVSGVLASAGWFTAMTIQNAAYVRALGQVELVFTFLASALVFRERTTRLELAGIALIVAGIVFLVLG